MENHFEPMFSEQQKHELITNRLSQRSRLIDDLVGLSDFSWNDAFFRLVIRAFGLGQNKPAFLALAQKIALKAAAHHRDNMEQVEAVFFGQAGLLTEDAIQEAYREASRKDEYLSLLRREYHFMQYKFHISAIEHTWKFGSVRPQNFPTVRLAELSGLFHAGSLTLSNVVESENMDDMRRFFSAPTSPYWLSHYVFSDEAKPKEKRISRTTEDLVIINAAVPMLYAWGRKMKSKRIESRSLELLEQLPAEDNAIVRRYKAEGFQPLTALDTQALLQYEAEYANR